MTRLIRSAASWALIQAFLLCQAVPPAAHALRGPQRESAAGLEEIKGSLTSAAGLEEIPPEANPLSGSYAPDRFRIVSPSAFSSTTLYDLAAADPESLLADVQAGRSPILRPKTERVGTALWADVEHRALLHELYGYYYDVRDYAPDFPPERVQRVIELLHHPEQGVAAAARDVIVNARIFDLGETVRALAEAYQKRGGSPGPYAAFYFHDAMTTRVDPVHRVEYGSPERPIFPGEMTDERMHAIHDTVRMIADPGNRLGLFTGSGQRLVTAIQTVKAGLKDRGDGRPTGFADPDLVGNDIGSQPHDAVLVLFGLVAKIFVESMPEWRREAGLPMPEEWAAAIGSDGRSSTGAITQVAARIFERMRVGVKMIGITSAPEAAARAYFSDPAENLLATFEITPSHINQAFNGTKLMLWLGQILPWAKAEAFNKKVQTAAQDFSQVQQVIEMLQDPDPAENAKLNERVAEDLSRLPAEYGDSRSRYHEYLKRSWTGNWLGDADSLGRDWQALQVSLRDLGIVGVLDLNGGARMTDLPLFSELFEGRFIIMAPDAGSYHHSLPPGRTTARPMMDFLAKAAPTFERAGMTLLPVIPDPDGDRKAMVYRDPVTRGFLYLDPQAGYLLDSIALVMAARDAGIPGIGIVSNSAGNPGIRFVMGDRLHAEVKFADVGEANVVQGILNLTEDLARRHGVDWTFDPSLSPQAFALEMRKRLAEKVSVGGGEPPAAAFIQGVMVRDMAQAFGTLFSFYRKPEWVKKVIQALYGRTHPARSEELTRQVDSVWYRPDQRQYLVHRLIHQVLPPMWSADPGDKTEKIVAVRPEDQRYFKRVMDEMLAPQGEWVARIRREMARIISERIGEEVSPEQITVSEPVNFNEADEVAGFGDEKRMLSDGRFDPTGGYAVNVSYRSAGGTDDLVATLWVRGSKTDVGVTRNLPMMAASFLPPEQGAAFQEAFRDAFHPLWISFNYDAEARELRGHVEGRFDGFHPSMLDHLTGSMDTLYRQMAQVRNTTYARHVEHPESQHFSEVDQGNMEETDAAARGAVRALGHLSQSVSDALSPLLDIIAADPHRTLFSKEEADRIWKVIRRVDTLLSGNFRERPIGDLPAAAREATAYRDAQQMVAETLRWKVGRFLNARDLIQGVKHLGNVLTDLQDFAAEGITADRYQAGATPPERDRGAAYANLVLDKIVLVREIQFAAGQDGSPAAGLEDRPPQITVPKPEARTLILLTPDTAEIGLRALNAFRPVKDGKKLNVAVIVSGDEQEARIPVPLGNAALELWDGRIINLAQSKTVLNEAIQGIVTKAVESGMATYVVEKSAKLLGVGFFLGLPDADQRIWEEWLRNAGLEEQA